MDDIDFRRAEMVRLAEAVRERLSNPARVNNVSVVLHVDAVEQILNLTNHVTALDSMLTEGTSTFPVRWMNDGTLGHESTTRPAEESRLAARVEELEAALTALNAYEDFSSPLTECDDCSSCCGYEDPSGINEARAKVHAALPPSAPKETDMDRCVACGHEREHHVPACRIGSPDDCHCAMFQEPTPKETE